MSDPLDDLLQSCSVASRAMRLLTAEAKRRAAVLRLCCTDYQRALDRLERLNAFKDLKRQHEADSAARESPSAGPGNTQQGGRNASSGATSSSDGRSTGVSAYIASGQRLLPMPDLDSSADRLHSAASCEDRVSRNHHQDSSGYDDATPSVTSDSSSITESLRQILEQARSIRTQEAAQQSSQGRGNLLSLAAGGARREASDDRARVSTPSKTARRAVSTGATSISRSATGVPPATRMSAMKSLRQTATARVATAPKKTPRGSSVVDGTTGTSGARNQPQPRHGVAQSPCGRRMKIRTIQDRKGTEAPVSPRRQPTSSSVSDDRRRLSTLDTQRMELLSSEQDKEKIQVAAVVRPAGGDLELPEGAWEEVKRYASARSRFMGLGSGGRASRGSSSRERFATEEAALLRRLGSGASRDPGPVVPRECGQVTAVAMPNARFDGWRDQAQSGLLEKDMLYGQGRVEHTELYAGSVAGVENRDVSGDALVEGDGRRAAERWADVERLQRSLLMLLDEVEGRRDVLAAKERSRTTLRGRRDSEPRGVDGRTNEESKGAGVSARDFEDWYCWNKVAHVTRLLQMHVGAIDQHRCGGGGADITLSKEASALIENPSLALGEDNPLGILLKRPEDGCVWQQAWQDSEEVQGLGDTACLALVKGLQADASTCCPLEHCWPHHDSSAPTKSSSSPSRKNPAAEQFAQQLRYSFILAAERDVFRLVTPALARGLSQALRQPPPPDLQRYRPDKNGQGQDRDSRQHLYGADSSQLKHLREQVSRASLGQGVGCAHENEMLWSPTMAVFRAVDAMLSGGGRPRISFVRRRAR